MLSVPGAQHAYLYALDRPLLYVDPSGRAPLLDAEGNIVLNRLTYRPMLRGSLRAAEETIFRDYAQVNDLEGMALTSDVIASAYRDWDRFLREMGRVFVGTPATGPTALVRGLFADKCAALGREREDCRRNDLWWTDEGFHGEYRDTHNQPFHAWAHVAQTAVPGCRISYPIALYFANLGNVVHDPVQSLFNVRRGWGTSWQDYYLSVRAWEVGRRITLGQLTPAQLGDVMRQEFGPTGGGSGGWVPFLNGIPYVRMRGTRD